MLISCPKQPLIIVILIVLLLSPNVLGEPIDFSKYHRFKTIEKFLLYLASTHDVRLVIIGYSWKGRPLYALLIGDLEKKPIVLIVGLHHGREIVSAQFPLYFIWLLLTNDSYSCSLNSYAFIIVPILNPDGYEEAFRNPWQRKNCRPIDDDGDGLVDEDPPEDLDGDGRIARYRNATHIWYEGIDNDGDGKLNEDWIGGVDLNRNYAFSWERGSKVKGSLIYKGPNPFSEPETRALDLLIRYYARRIVIALSYHSGVSLILYPWSCKREAPPEERLFKEIGEVYANITHYRLMQSSHLYLAFGEFSDYLYHEFNILTFTIEIYGRVTDAKWIREHEVKIGKTRIFKYIFEAFNPKPGEELLKVLKLNALALNVTLAYYREYAWTMYRYRVEGSKPNPSMIMLTVAIITALAIIVGYKGACKPE